MNCKYCHTEINSTYCPNCGQPATLKRIDWHYITHEIEHVLHLERGIFYTIKELAIRPGDSVKQFIAENRSRLVKPIIFIIVASLIYSLINHFFHIEEGYVNFSQQKLNSTGKIFIWVQNHYGYANIIMGIFIALWTKLFFRKYDFNFFEILILNCFVIGMAMLIYALFAMIQGIIHVDLLAFGGMAALIYSTWAIGQFFDKHKIFNYVKAFAAYMFGMITSLVLAFALGTLADIILN